MTIKDAASNSKVAWSTLMQELRSIKTGGSKEAMLTKKRRATFDQQDLSATAGERKLRCRRNSKVNDVLGESSPTFLDLNPPSPTEATSLTFTFGRHYKSISLASLANASCNCSKASSSKFDVFSSYQCPCKTRSFKSPTKSLNTSKSSAPSSSKKVRPAEAI